MKRYLLYLLISMILANGSMATTFASSEEQTLPDTVSEDSELILEEEMLENQPEAEVPDIRQDKFYRARVIEVEQVTSEVAGQTLVAQVVTVELVSGDKKGSKVIIDSGGGSDLEASQQYQEGDTIIVTESQVGDTLSYFIYDMYRFPGILIVVAIFLVLTVVFARLRGIGSIIGLLISIGILMTYIVPQLLQGANPVWVTLFGTMSIVSITLFISHGFRLRSLIAFVSTLITLSVSYAMSFFFVRISHMFGSGTEETFYLKYIIGDSMNVNIDLRGILLGGIIIGMLGVLDDVTIGQAAALDEIKRANPKMSLQRLYQAGMSVGRDHIASLVNTLALAYVGSSLPLFLLLYVNQANVPLWVVINSEFISQEIIRTVAGSLAVILAVPITTILAAYIYQVHPSKPRTTQEVSGHNHGGHHH